MLKNMSVLMVLLGLLSFGSVVMANERAGNTGVIDSDAATNYCDLPVEEGGWGDLCDFPGNPDLEGWLWHFSYWMYQYDQGNVDREQVPPTYQSSLPAEARPTIDAEADDANPFCTPLGGGKWRGADGETYQDDQCTILD